MEEITCIPCTLIAAVRRFRARIQKAIPATKLFRFNILNLYDVGKAPCDTFCRAIADLLDSSTFKFNGRAVLATRLMYFCFIASMNLYTFMSTWRSLRPLFSSTEGRKPTFHELRRKQRGDTRVTDQALLFAEDLLRSPVELGRQSFASNLSRTFGPSSQEAADAQSPLTKEEIIMYKQIVASNKKWAWERVAARAKSAKRRVGPEDFFGGAPSPDFMIPAQRLRRTRPMISIFGK